MKKRYLTLLVVLALNKWCYAQTTWGINSTRTDYRDDAGLQGNAGAISGFYETANPVNFPNGAGNWWHLLDVRHDNPANNFAMQFSGSFFDQNLFFRKTNNNASQAWSKVLLETDSKVGIGTTSPTTTLDIAGNQTLRNSQNVPGGGASIHFTSYGSEHKGAMIRSYLDFAQGDNSICRLVLSSYSSGYKNELTLNGGRVGIGTMIPDATLAVKGNIHAQEVKVDLNVPGPDYVFDKAYSLRPLSDLKNYITNNRHLPEIASAETMERDGINVSELNMTMLKKIEELTLYLLQKDAAMKKQAQRIERLEQLVSKSSLKTNRPKNRPAR